MDKNQAAVRATVHSLQVTLGVTTFAALIFGTLAAVVLTRRTAASLKRLTEMIRDIADGEGDVTKRLEAAGGFDNDEVGEVSRLFNHFMDKLQEILRGDVDVDDLIGVANHAVGQALFDFHARGPHQRVKVRRNTTQGGQVDIKARFDVAG